MRIDIEQWPMATPFRIAGYTFLHMDVLVVKLIDGDHVGRGEASGVYYRGDAPAVMRSQLEGLRDIIEAGIDRTSLQTLLVPGGARNALDCALWDLEAKLTGRSVWRNANLDPPRPLVTTFTCGADDPLVMADRARVYRGARAVKLKLTGEPIDAERVRAVRDALPGTWLSVDANQGLTRDSLHDLMPALTEAHVSLIEQPFPIGQDAWLDGLESPIPIAADESIQSAVDIPAMVGRFQMINIKLDKCGGLTEALAMLATARAYGLRTMVGNMSGTSLAAAPAFLVGQSCDVVDLDGPALLGADRTPRVAFDDGMIHCPESIWGYAGPSQ
jgi:L-alanine-DL-glutamate epimerase-like enolase superfamily enzyme